MLLRGRLTTSSQWLLLNSYEYFIKAIDGECASFVKKISSYDDFEKLGGQLKTGKYIFQDVIEQSKAMDVINPASLNTLRIVTINKGENTYVLSSLLRIGTAKTGNVDNWAAGGLAIGINDDGYLKKYGFYKPTFGLKTDIHPDTNVVFTEFAVPMYKEACNLACKAHKVFYDVRAIGWDIAISKDGPIFVEGNDNFEISLQQACDKPLKAEWIKAME